ncbi:addiction module protein [Prosthecobacter sp.]|uniref:addiction module protein n=1 Tax=Prosthecobacter sp. TaxID=1965333 RepID=UPI0037830232
MTTLLPLDQMSRGEKLRALMDLENDLFPVTDDKQPPSWHLELLEETERRLAAGEEQFVSLEEARRRMAGLKQCV